MSAKEQTKEKMMIVVCSGQTWREGGHVIAASDPAVVSGCCHSPAAPTTRRRRCRGRPSIDCVHRGHLDVSRRPTLCAATVHRVRVLNWKGKKVLVSIIWNLDYFRALLIFCEIARHYENFRSVLRIECFSMTRGESLVSKGWKNVSKGRHVEEELLGNHLRRYRRRLTDGPKKGWFTSVYKMTSLL